MDPSRAHGTSAEPAEANGLPEAQSPLIGPLKSIGLWVIVPPCPLLSAPLPSIEVQRFVQSAFSMANFFKKYFVRKNWRGGGELMNCY